MKKQNDYTNSDTLNQLINEIGDNIDSLKLNMKPNRLGSRITGSKEKKHISILMDRIEWLIKSGNINHVDILQLYSNLMFINNNYKEIDIYLQELFEMTGVIEDEFFGLITMDNDELVDPDLCDKEYSITAKKPKVTHIHLTIS